MRIGFDAKRAFFNRTGLGNYSRYILDNLLKFAPNLKTFAYTKRRNEELYPQFPQDRVALKKVKGPDFLWRSFSISRQLEADGIDIFHGLSNEIPFGLKKRGIKSVVTIHDLIFLRKPEYYKWVDRKIYKWKFRYACRNADRVIAISQQTKADIVDFFGVESEKIEVIYQACSDRFASVPEENESRPVLEKYGFAKPFILCVGSIEPRKNQLNLVKAFALSGLQKEAELWIVGRGKSYKQELEVYVKAKGLDSVKILSDVSNKELHIMYHTAHLAAYVSEFEGFGIPVLEAIRAGLPVLSAKGSCLEEAGGTGALYADPHSLEEMSDKMKALFSDEDLRANVIRAGSEHLQKFDDEKLTEQLLQLYAQL